MNACSKYLLLVLMMLTPLLSEAQNDDNRSWWKRLFKPETVEQLEEETPEQQMPEEPEVEIPMDRSEKDSLNLTIPLTGGPGSVSISSPVAVDSLDSFKQRQNARLDGYRIQIFQGTLTESKEQRTDFVTRRLEDQCYLVQTRPYFSLRLGDFRTELEAYKRLRELREHYPQAYVVADKIEWPKLETSGKD